MGATIKDNKSSIFKIISNSSECKARAGVLSLYHGEVKTPVFMPVGTNGTVKTFLPYELSEMDTEIILSNAYHLYLRPGMEVIENASGLHNFCNWNRNILTDSGGFQLFSLSQLTKIKKNGIEFQSHIDGSRHFLTPEDVVDIQRKIGSDIMMVLDHCTEAKVSEKEATEALVTTTEWAKISRDYYLKTVDIKKQKQFGIIQGNMYPDLRRRSAEEIVNIGFDGYAIGGLSVGETKEQFLEILGHTVDFIPQKEARYLMGVGTPLDLFYGVENGIDMFDCVFPTRVARNALALTNYGRLNLRNEKYKLDLSPIDSECDCFVCKNFSKSYIRHLFKAKEITAARMMSYHNIYFMKDLMNKIRDSIINNNFLNFKRVFFNKYRQK